MRVICLLALWLVSGVLLAEGKVYETRLENGLKVIVKEDNRAPIMVSQVWYKVGASYEPAGVTGVSHVLEHMMFKGTKKYDPGEFSRIIAANGGQENAFTGRDYTAYFQTMSNDRLALSLEMEADRMRNLTLLQEEFAKEVEVVKEERRLRTEDKPTGKTYEQFTALAYRSLPYSNPIIGWMNDLDNMKIEDLAQWYRYWYAPNNATLVVVGDVVPDEVVALAKKHFGPLKAEDIPQLKPLREAPQFGEIRSVVKLPAREPYLLMGYKAPVAATAEEEWEPYALEMLVAILDGGNSSRFSKNLVRGKEVAVSAGASYNAFTRLSTLFLLDGVPSKGHSIAELEDALRAEVKLVQDELVDLQDLERVRTQVIASRVFELDSVFYQAMKIGTLETIGLSWRLSDEYVDRIKAITPEQLRQVANKYLVDDQLTVTVLEPLPMEQEKTAIHNEGGAKVDKKYVNLMGLLTLLLVGTISTAFAGPNIERWNTSKGARVLFVHAPDLPMVTLRVVFDAGSARETLPGVAQLTNALLEDGAGEWDAQQVAERLESVGSEMSFASLRDMAYLSVRTLSEEKALDMTMDTLAVVLGSPIFAEADLERSRKSMQSTVLRDEQSPGAVAKKAFYKAIFAGHSYASEPGGTSDSLKAISRQDVLEHYQNYYVAKNALVVLVGAVDKREATRLAELVTSKLSEGKAAPALAKMTPLAKAEELRVEFPSSQSHILTGQTGMRRGDKDYFPLYVGNHILGGSGLVSQLSEEVREKRGLSYSVYSYFSPMRQDGPFILGAQTKNANVAQALDVIRKTVNHFVEQGPSDAELTAAKQNITGGFPLQIASNSKIVGYLAMLGFYDLPLDYLDTFVDSINAVTREQIKDAFERRLNPDKFITVVVGNGQETTTAK